MPQTALQLACLCKKFQICQILYHTHTHTHTHSHSPKHLQPAHTLSTCLCNSLCCANCLTVYWPFICHMFKGKKPNLSWPVHRHFVWKKQLLINFPQYFCLRHNTQPSKHCVSFKMTVDFCATNTNSKDSKST